MSSEQITIWLQGLFLFALVWSLGGTITGDSRKKFDIFFRNLLSGKDDENPRPKSIKLKKNSIFPERGHNITNIILHITTKCPIISIHYHTIIFQGLSMSTTSIRMGMDSGTPGLIQSLKKRTSSQREPKLACPCV